MNDSYPIGSVWTDSDGDTCIVISSEKDDITVYYLHNSQNSNLSQIVFNRPWEILVKRIDEEQ